MGRLLKKYWVVFTLLLLVVFSATEHVAQDAPKALIEGKISASSGKKLGGATIVVKKNGAVVETVTSTSSGKYPAINIPMGFMYTITVTMNGYVSKEIAIDAKTGFYAEDSPEVIPMDIPFELDEMKPDVDYSSISNGFQIGKLSIDPATGGLTIDQGFTSTQSKKYKKFFEDLEKEANKAEEDFKKFVENGDKAFQAGNYDEALNNYNQALQIKENDPGVTGKVTTTEQKIAQKKSFDKLVTDGDGALSSKNYDQAIAKYKEAKALMPEDKTIDAKIKAAEDQKAAAEGAEIEAKYQAKIKEAQKAFADKDYAFAKTLYQEAGTIKPSEKEPPTKIAEIEKIIQDELAKEQKFNELVAAGDKGMLDENYDVAIEKYSAALQVKEDARVQSELAKAKDLKKKKEEADAAAAKKAEFDKFIASGDGKLNSEDFDAAITEYQKALDLGVDNATANAKIKAAQDQKKAKEDADAAAAKKAEFDKFIASGDGKLNSEDYDAAITEYQKALDLGVDNATANAKIKAAQDQKKAKEDADAAAQKQAEFDKLIASGDGKLGGEDFDAAIAEYQKALDLGVDNATANAKIKEAQDKKKAKQDAEAAAEKQAEFEKLIASGDSKLGSEDYSAAISDYQKALALGVDDPTANAKIKEAERLRDEKAASDAAAAEKAKFDELIASGDGKLGSEDYSAAISDYQKALALGVDDPTANAKIKEAERLRDEKAASDAAAAEKIKFDELISSGDGKLGNEDFSGAIADYQSALKLGVDDAKANAKIKEAEALRDAKNDADAAAAKFNEFIASGDSKLGNEDFAGAIADYQSALKLGVDDPTANAKIKEAERLRDEKAASDAASAEKAKFDEYIASGDSKLAKEDFTGAIADYQSALKLGVDDPKATAKIKEAEALRDAKNDAAAAAAKFQEYLASGDSKLGSEDYDGAIADYQSALKLGVDDPTATAKIKEAEKLRDAKSASDAAAAEKAKFDEYIASGDSKLGGEDFDGAISEYQKALKLGFDDPKATAKIAEAEKLRNAKNEAASAAQKQAKFDEYVSKGDGYLSSEQFDMAINTYQMALDLNVNNPLATQKIQEAKDAKYKFDQNAAANAEQAALDKKFNDLIKQGDQAKDAKSWEEAKDYYSQAKEVKTESPIPQQKIDEVNRLMEEETLADQQAQLQKYLEKGKQITDAGEFDKAIGLYNKAKGLFPGEAILDQRIKEVEALKAQEDKYNQFMAIADGLFEAGKWQEAKAEYLKAKNVFDRPRPNEQIAIIDKKMAEEANANNEAAELAKLKAQYDALMTKGKQLKDAKSYQEAIGTYTEAKNLMPNETEPQKRIDEIQALLDQMANQNALLEKYQAAIAKADAKRDEAIASKDKDIAGLAKDLYGEANKIKADETYPQDQVNKLNDLMSKWASAEADEQYQKIIDKADELFTAKNWDGAEKLYNRANSLKPIDPYPPSQLEKIKNARAKAGALNAYNEFIKEGNQLFQDKSYKPAIAAYEKALGEKPDAKYPQDKIDEINRILNDMAQAAKEQEKIENAAKRDPNYLGDEMVGMSEEEIDQMFKDMRVEEVTDRDKLYQDYKDETALDENEELNSQEVRTGSINDSYEEMEQERSDLESAWDDQRKEILPEMIDFKERESETYENRYNAESNRAQNLDDYYNNSEQVRSEYELELDGRRKDNIDDLEQYKLDQNEWTGGLADSEMDLTYNNDQYYVDAQGEREIVDVRRDDRRLVNIDNVESYKEDRLEITSELTNGERDLTYQNNEYYESVKDDNQDVNENSEERREDLVVSMEEYKESNIEIENDRIDQGVSVTYDLHDDYEVMREEFEQFAEDGDSRRKEKTIIEMEEYQDEQLEFVSEKTEHNVDVTTSNQDYYVKYSDYLEDFAEDMDIPRDENVSAMEIYQDNMSESNVEDLETMIDRGLDNYSDKEKVKEDQLGMFEEEGVMVENNIADMEAYKEAKLEAQEEITTNAGDAGYNNSLVMDSVKTQKATMFSDLNVDPLSAEYPEGITEKMFKRTNNYGEVIEVTIVRIVVRGNKADEYKKISSKWSTSYFKNGGVINEYVWDTETN